MATSVSEAGVSETGVRETTLADAVEADLFGAQAPRRLRAAYGFDDVAIVPGVETIHPDDVDLSWRLGDLQFAIPFIASAMDGVVDVPFAIAVGRLGGLAVLNLEGVQTRYERPDEPLAEIAASESGLIAAARLRAAVQPGEMIALIFRERRNEG